MTREQEEKIIRQAQDILERRMAVEKDIKINLQNLLQYSSYYQGAIVVADRLAPYVMKNYRNEDKIYIKAELDLMLSSKRNMQLWLEGERVGYINHERDKKGKLIKVDAYFFENEKFVMKKNSANKIKAFLSLKKSFYRKIWQQNGYYPIEKFVWNEEEKAWERFVQKTSGWHSRGISFKDPFTCPDGEIITNNSWWFSVFLNNPCILSYREMNDNHNFDKN